MLKNQYDTKQTPEPAKIFKKNVQRANYYYLKYELNIKNALFTPSLLILAFWRVIHKL